MGETPKKQIIPAGTKMKNWTFFTTTIHSTQITNEDQFEDLWKILLVDIEANIENLYTELDEKFNELCEKGCIDGEEAFSVSEDIYKFDKEFRTGEFLELYTDDNLINCWECIQTYANEEFLPYYERHIEAVLKRQQ